MAAKGLLARKKIEAEESALAQAGWFRSEARGPALPAETVLQAASVLVKDVKRREGNLASPLEPLAAAQMR